MDQISICKDRQKNVLICEFYNQNKSYMENEQTWHIVL